MNFNFKPLGNTRTQKDEFAKVMIATSVLSNFRIPPYVAKQLGITDGDAVSMFSHSDEETGETRFFIGKGHKGTLLLDENGEPVKGNRGVSLYTEDDPKDGSVVRPTTADANVLSISSATAWKMLGGSTTKELEIALTSIGEMDYPLPSGKLVFGEVFEMVVTKERELDAKEKAESVQANKVSEAQDLDVQEELNDTDFQEEEV